MEDEMATPPFDQSYGEIFHSFSWQKKKNRTLVGLGYETTRTHKLFRLHFDRIFSEIDSKLTALISGLEWCHLIHRRISASDLTIRLKTVQGYTRRSVTDTNQGALCLPSPATVRYSVGWQNGVGRRRGPPVLPGIALFPLVGREFS